LEEWSDHFDSAKEYLEWLFKTETRFVFKYVAAADCSIPGILVDRLGIWRYPKPDSKDREIVAPKLLVARFDEQEKYTDVQVFDEDRDTFKMFKLTKSEWLSFRKNLSSREAINYVPY
jgi:hypothetical protein